MVIIVTLIAGACYRKARRYSDKSLTGQGSIFATNRTRMAPITLPSLSSRPQFSSRPEHHFSHAQPEINRYSIIGSIGLPIIRHMFY
jgi:hypothetical protein